MRCLSLLTLGLAAIATSPTLADCTASERGQVELYPTTEILPENLLRVYLYFPTSIRRGDVLDHIELRDEDGVAQEGVFLETRAGIWSPNRQRLTLLLNPGRVKTGLQAHEVLGRALVAGQSYTLVLKDGLVDSDGCTLAGFSHQFLAGPADLRSPTPADWVITPPMAGTTDPVEITLDGSNDHLSLAYRIRVRTGDGERVPGRISLDHDEALWRFSPHDPWSDTDYKISVDPQLEDLAGNRPGRLFDQPADVGSDAMVTIDLAWRPQPTP